MSEGLIASGGKNRDGYAMSKPGRPRVGHIWMKLKPRVGHIKPRDLAGAIKRERKISGGKG
ncbi:hypothetical protein KAU30_00450 [Candidatus Bathyarchaeota archaeon]|nr:hypothetical protein [Candidatus Bathyarchaeota archaeon]